MSTRTCKTHIRTPAMVSGVLLMLINSACSMHLQSPHLVAPPAPQEAQVFAPAPGRQADFFRAVEIVITVDFEQASITAEPHDPFCPGPEAERAGKCNVIAFEAPPTSEAQAMHASLEETHSFAQGMRSERGATTLYRIPRIFYPPTSTGSYQDGKRQSMQHAHGCRPEKPARQFRWIVQCTDGTTDCLRGDDQVIIRPKMAAHAAASDTPMPSYVLLDRLASVFPQYQCLRDFSAPQPPEAMPGDSSQDAAPSDNAYKAYEAFVERHNKHFAAKNANDLEQAETLFSPQTRAYLSIIPSCGKTQQSCPGCCQASATSGIPNNPHFLKPGSGVMWTYAIELWRGGEQIQTLDPPGWIEDDGDPGSG